MVLFSVLKEVFGVLLARYNRARASQRGGATTSSSEKVLEARPPQVVEEQTKDRQRHANGSKGKRLERKATNEDGKKKLWGLLNSESESDDVSSIRSSEERAEAVDVPKRKTPSIKPLPISIGRGRISTPKKGGKNKGGGGKGANFSGGKGSTPITE